MKVNENNDEEKGGTQNKQLLSSSPHLSVEQNYNNVFHQDDRHQNNASTSNSYIDDVGSHYIAAIKEKIETASQLRP